MNSTLETRFWENVAMVLAQRRRSIRWLEREAALATCKVSTSRTKELGLKLSTLLKVAKILGMNPDDLLYGHFIFVRGGRNEN